MIPHKQEFAHDPENGVYGDCFRTAIACLLDVIVSSVPHFLHDGNADEGIPRAQEYLKRHGLQLVEIPLDGDLESALAIGLEYLPGLNHLLVGESRTGCNHVVICRDGAIVHDPSQTDAGIVGPTDTGHFWLGFLARLL